jgi:hypothetical protein
VERGSQLTYNGISNINGGNWLANYVFNNNGDTVNITIQVVQSMLRSNQTDFTYSGNQMIIAGGSNLDYDENGQLTSGIDTSLVWNWDSKLRSATQPFLSMP